MGPKIIADSSALISLAVIDDSNHLRAVELSQQFSKTSQEIVIPAEIFSETVNILGKKINHTYAGEFFKSIVESRAFEVISISEEVRRESLERFIQQKNSVSYTDCLVMACADEYETKAIFGFEEVFFRSGYGLS